MEKLTRTELQWAIKGLECWIENNEAAMIECQKAATVQNEAFAAILECRNDGLRTTMGTMQRIIDSDSKRIVVG